MFGKLLIIAQQREEVSMKEVLSYSLSPIPWSLALPDGGLVKTVKAKLLDVIAKNTTTIDALRNNCALIIDGMVILQQTDASSLATFGDLAESILDRVLRWSKFEHVYFVTDQYRKNSIKGYERRRCGEALGKLRIKVERRDQKLPTQFRKFLRHDENKTEIVRFLLEEWLHSTRYLTLLAGQSLFVNVEDNYFCIKV